MTIARSYTDGILRPIFVTIVSLWMASLARRFSQLPIPNDAPQVHSSGGNADKVLVFGSGLAIGWGVLTHELALPGAIARALSSSTGRGADVNVIAEETLTVTSARKPVGSLRLPTFDAVVVTLGLNDVLALVRLTVWERELRLVLAALVAAADRGTPIAVVGLQPIRSIPLLDSWPGDIVSAHADAMNSITEAVCSEFPTVMYVPLTVPAVPARLGRVESGQYLQWGREISARLAPRLDRAAGESGSGGRIGIDEEERQRSVDLLGLADKHSDVRLQSLVSTAQRVLGVDTAMFTVLDGTRQINLIRSGSDVAEIPRESSLCEFAIRESSGMIVPDARADPRFRDNPLVIRNPSIRFYAGFPIESPDGQRVGALCVVDSTPRSATDHNMNLLRELALLIQRELWRYVPSA